MVRDNKLETQLFVWQDTCCAYTAPADPWIIMNPYIDHLQHSRLSEDFGPPGFGQVFHFQFQLKISIMFMLRFWVARTVGGMGYTMDCFILFGLFGDLRNGLQHGGCRRPFRFGQLWRVVLSSQPVIQGSMQGSDVQTQTFGIASRGRWAWPYVHDNPKCICPIFNPRDYHSGMKIEIAMKLRYKV